MKNGPVVFDRRWIGSLREDDIPVLKARLVPGEAPVPAYGGEPALEDHFAMLVRAFCGQPQLLLYHALLIVLLRRRIDADAGWTRYQALWRREGAFLAERLDMRWLVSACDTFIDFSPDPGERALALSGTLFANTLKLYETERWAVGTREADPAYQPIDRRVDLFDGMTAFVIGQGDMVLNLHRRAAAVTRDATPCALILDALLRRASQHDTVFRRLRRRHTHAATAW